MFDIGWTELLVVAVIAIIVVGPKDLPRMLRTFGQTVGKVRRMAGEFQSTFNEALREAEQQADISDMKKQVEKAGNFDPLSDLKKSIESEPRKSKAASKSAGDKEAEPQAAKPAGNSDDTDGKADVEPAPAKEEQAQADGSGEAQPAPDTKKAAEGSKA